MSEDFLEFCIRAGGMEPLFIRLVGEYREAPTICKAVALYDIFCAPCAPAKVNADPLLPPFDMRIQKAMRPIKLNWTRLQAAFVFGPSTHICSKAPSRSLFDGIVDYLANSETVRDLKRRYREVVAEGEGRFAPIDHFQQHFLERIWNPIISPHLLAAGFSELPGLAAAA